MSGVTPSGFTVTLLGTGGSAGTPQTGGADGKGDWGDCDPAEPRNRRSRASILIQSADGKRLLVDTGPDVRTQLLAARVPLVDAVLYTHPHADHIAGLDEVRILNRLLGAPMPGYAEAATWAQLRQRFDYAFRPWDGKGFFRPVFAPHVIAPGEAVETAGLTIQIIGLDHGFGTTLGLRIGGFAYCTDVVRMDEAALAALTGLDVLVVDCFTPDLPHPTHANLATVFGWVDRLKPKRTVLTHMGPTMDFARLLRTLPKGIEPGYDGMVLSFGAGT